MPAPKRLRRRTTPKHLLLAATLIAVAGLAVAVTEHQDDEASTPRRRLVNQVTAAEMRATHDKFGISNIEPTRSAGTIWVSNWEGKRRFDGVDPQDPWFDADHGSARFRVSNGLLFISGAVPRMYVHDPTLERQWRDVEVTIYFKRVADDGVPHAGMTAVARANHLSDAKRCDTRGYGGRIRYDGHTDFEKETAHPLNDARDNQTLWRGGMPYNQWIGYKFIVYDQQDGVHLESWLDRTDGLNGGSWVKINELVDNGHLFGQDPCAPGMDPRMTLTSSPERAGSESGRPNVSVYFRSDGVHSDGLVYKWGSIREIDPR